MAHMSLLLHTMLFHHKTFSHHAFCHTAAREVPACHTSASQGIEAMVVGTETMGRKAVVDIERRRRDRTVDILRYC